MIPKPANIRLTVLVAIISVVLGLGATAYAAKGSGGHPKAGSGSSTLKLVLENSTDGSAHYGQIVTFAVSTTATNEPFVRVNCYEGGVWVLSSSSGFFAGYPWPWTQHFTLSWDMWHTPGAAADCVATLYNGGATYATLPFHVFA
jgi:hypothetical protein